MPHAEIKIVDENDEEVPVGTVGELCVRGPHVMKGYYKMPETSAKALKNGWMHTGDGETDLIQLHWHTDRTTESSHLVFFQAP